MEERIEVGDGLTVELNSEGVDHCSQFELRGQRFVIEGNVVLRQEFLDGPPVAIAELDPQFFKFDATRERFSNCCCAGDGWWEHDV